MKFPFLIGVLLVALINSVYAADPSLKSDKEKFGYALGLQQGSALQRIPITVDDFDMNAYIQGVKDVLAGQPPRISRDEMGNAFESFDIKLKARVAKIGEKNKKAGEAYRAKYKGEKGVTSLSTGLLYRVLKSGSGNSPKPESTVSVHYRGTLINGKEFDSSLRRGQPATFPVNGVIRGWQDILPLMKVGDKWEVVIPENMAYGERGTGPGGIGPNETLVFEIELLEIK